MEIGQEFVIYSFDNLQGGKGEWPKTRCKRCVKFAPNKTNKELSKITNAPNAYTHHKILTHKLIKHSMSSFFIFLFIYHPTFAIFITNSLNHAHTFAHSVSLYFHISTKFKNLFLSSIINLMNPSHIRFSQPMSSHLATYNNPKTIHFNSNLLTYT